MYRSQIIPAVALGLLLLTLLLLPLHASAEDEDEQGVERSVTLEELPPAVKATILKEAGTHKVRDIEEITLPDRVFYEAEWKVDGQEIEIKVAPDGTLLRSDAEDDDGDDEEDDD
jgi:hypothetical protein